MSVRLQAIRIFDRLYLIKQRRRRKRCLFQTNFFMLAVVDSYLFNDLDIQLIKEILEYPINIFM
jgi:hypothetical protein